MGRLDSKIAVITGGARGMGAETARMFAQHGATVVITDVLDDLGETTAATNDAISYSHLDVRSETDWTAVIDSVMDRHGRVDVLVNNAGVDLVKSLAETSLAEYERVISINQIGTFLGMQTVAAAMISSEQPCSLINISSVAGLEGVAGHAAYSSTKFAVTGLTKAAAKEWGKHGVRVNSVHPGIIETPMTEDQRPFTDPELRRRVERSLPLRRMGQPSDIAHMVLFLGSDESSYCTGQAFTVDGGVHA